MKPDSNLKRTVSGALFTIHHPAPKGAETVILQRGDDFCSETEEDARIDARFGWTRVGLAVDVAHRLGMDTGCHCPLCLRKGNQE